jgi:hypothetical protein
MMFDTELEIAKRQVSELRVRLLQQQSIVLGLRGEGGVKLEEATALLNSMMDELIDLEAKWDGLVNAA